MTRFGRLALAGSVPRSRVLWIAAGAVVALGAAGALLLAASGGEDGALDRRDVVVEGERWRVTLSAEPERAARTTTVQVRLAVTNTSDSAIQGLEFATTRQFVLIARDEQAEVAWRVAFPRRKLTITRSVAPGSTAAYVEEWPTADDPPGRYSVEGRILDSDLREHSRLRTSVVLE